MSAVSALSSTISRRMAVIALPPTFGLCNSMGASIALNLERSDMSALTDGYLPAGAVVAALSASDRGPSAGVVGANAAATPAGAGLAAGARFGALVATRRTVFL